MKKILFIFTLFLLITNCSKSPDNNSETNNEIDVSEGQTNWTKHAYYDTITNPRTFIDSQGYIVVTDIAIRGDHVVMVGGYSKFETQARAWESTDAGITWQAKSSLRSCGKGSDAISVSIPADNVVYILATCGHEYQLTKSFNGEESFIFPPSHTLFTNDSMHFFDENIGVIGNIKTTDGGESWNIMEDLEWDFHYVSNTFSFINTQIGYCVISSTDLTTYQSTV